MGNEGEWRRRRVGNAQNSIANSVEALIPPNTRYQPVGRGIVSSVGVLDRLLNSIGHYLRYNPWFRLAAFFYFIGIHIFLFFVISSWSHALVEPGDALPPLEGTLD